MDTDKDYYARTRLSANNARDKARRAYPSNSALAVAVARIWQSRKKTLKSRESARVGQGCPYLVDYKWLSGETVDRPKRGFTVSLESRSGLFFGVSVSPQVRYGLTTGPLVAL